MRQRNRKRKLFWQIFSSFLVISLALLILVTFYATATLRSHYLSEARQSLVNHTATAGLHAAQLTDQSLEGQVNDLCRRFSKDTHLRYTVIRDNGLVIGDSHYQAAAMEPHDDRPEIIDALDGAVGAVIRKSETLNQKMLYVARSLPLADGSKIVVRASRPLNEIDAVVLDLQVKIGMAWLIANILAAAAFLLISQRISRPFEHLQAKALSMIGGEVNEVEVPHFELEEAENLSTAITKMVQNLDERTSTITQQREELEAILSSMSEALLAVDRDGNILKINRMMADVFGLDPTTSRGQKIETLVRNADFLDFLEEAMGSGDMVHADLTFYSPNPRLLRGSGTRLRDTKGNVIGAVIVLNDLTRLKRLEDLRKDFVANVSHELRTPITSIKGFVETLEGGALEDPDAARRFLGIISRQTNRLSNIIEDLLSLSKIEQQEGRWQLELEPRSLDKALKGAMRYCEEQAAEKSIALELDCPSNLQPKLHPSLFEQAVVNLVDNAIKYSESNKVVKVVAEAKGDHLDVKVKDQGVGIPRAHLPRLFERFYRVDKARSRDVGGTGLGLSIVKHIAVAHGGNVRVKSEVGRGSVFTITLPAN